MRCWSNSSRFVVSINYLNLFIMNLNLPTISKFHFNILKRDLQPVRFYPYTTFVQMRIFEEEDREPNSAFLDFCYEIKRRVIERGVKWDNKVVIELSRYEGETGEFKSGVIYLGYCDNQWALGLGIWTPDYKSSTYKSCIINL